MSLSIHNGVWLLKSFNFSPRHILYSSFIVFDSRVLVHGFCLVPGHSFLLAVTCAESNLEVALHRHKRLKLILGNFLEKKKFYFHIQLFRCFSFCLTLEIQFVLFSFYFFIQPNRPVCLLSIEFIFSKPLNFIKLPPVVFTFITLKLSFLFHSWEWYLSFYCNDSLWCSRPVG